MKVEKGNFEMVSYGICNPDKITADNGQHIIDLYENQDHKEGEIVTAIPLDECHFVRTDEDLSQYGFEKVEGNLWQNPKYQEPIK